MHSKAILWGLRNDLVLVPVTAKFIAQYYGVVPTETEAGLKCTRLDFAQANSAVYITVTKGR